MESRVEPVKRDYDLFSDGEWARTQQELGLSPRQAEIVKLVLQGKSDRQIALDLHISLATVRTHLRRLFGKFNLGDRLELTLLVLASLRGRVQSPPPPSK
jgi:DNA-binding CsgD family transcriptional regulator